MARKKKGRKTGRPSKFSEERARVIVATLTAGSYVEVAAAKAGIATSTLNDWRRAGERAIEKTKRTAEESRFAKFAEDCRIAEGKLEDKCASGLLKMALDGAGDGRILVEFMARRFPQRWGTSQRVDHTSSDKSMTPVGAVGVVILPPMANEDGTTGEEASAGGDSSPEGAVEAELGSSD